MKLKKLTSSYKTKLTKLILINTRIYNKKILFDNIKIEDIAYQLKKGLQIIYKYYINNKRILFIGGIKDNNTLNRLNKTKNTWISESEWSSGLLTNNMVNLKKQAISNKLLQFRKKYDLIVILNCSGNKNIINESYSAKIPTIYLDNTLLNINNECSYKILGNFKFSKSLRNNFLYSIIIATLNRANNFKNEKYI